MAKTKSTPEVASKATTRRRKTAKVTAPTETIEVEAPKAKVKAPKVKTPRPTQQAYDRRKDGTLSARGLSCLCGCGLPTQTPDSRFLSGHDAKLRKALLTDKLPCPEIVRPFFENGEVIGGVALEGGEFVDMKSSRAGGIVTEEDEG